MDGKNERVKSKNHPSHGFLRLYLVCKGDLSQIGDCDITYPLAGVLTLAERLWQEAFRLTQRAVTLSAPEVLMICSPSWLNCGSGTRTHNTRSQSPVWLPLSSHRIMLFKNLNVNIIVSSESKPTFITAS